MPSYASQLSAVTEHWDPRRIADLLSNALTESERLPYCFVIDHDTRKGVRCQLDYDFTHKDMVGIETMDKETAKRWLVKAFLLGYTARHAGPDERRRSGLRPKHPYGDSYSITRALERAEWKRRADDHDDDIPF